MNIEKIKEVIAIKDGIYKKGIEENIIGEAENKLNIKFPKEYREFLENVGCLVVGADEIFGLGVEGFLNVVETTIEERSSDNVLKDYVVIKNEGIGYLIILNEEGKVFEYSNHLIKEIYGSFYEYISSEIL